MLSKLAHPVLIAGEWRVDESTDLFCATNPATRSQLDDSYPVSGWKTIDAALTAATTSAAAVRSLPDSAQRIALFLEGYAERIEKNADALVAAANTETGLPASPRLAGVELPRTTGQLRQAAAVARAGSWLHPVIDTKNNIRSCFGPIGPVWTIGPNNFPFAYNGIAGGDFAAAITAGNPVLAKAHPLHPTTSRLLAEAAHAAAESAGLPRGTVQMIYHMQPEDGLRLVGDSRLAAVAFTGSRDAGMKIKSAADVAGTLFFGEMSSLNPVVFLPGALAERAGEITGELVSSVLLATGQMCTKPGLVLAIEGTGTETFVARLAAQMSQAPSGVLLSQACERSLGSSVQNMLAAGAISLCPHAEQKQPAGFAYPNTVLLAKGKQFLSDPVTFQTEAFGNATLCIVAADLDELLEVTALLQGNLTGSVYSARDGSDDEAYKQIAALLRGKVGRLLNDKMPTGVAVSPAMNHGGPYPATSQPHFTAVGLPASVHRFTQLQCYDNVRQNRLPACLQDKNPTGTMWRQIDGRWTQENL